MVFDRAIIYDLVVYKSNRMLKNNQIDSQVKVCFLLVFALIINFVGKITVFGNHAWRKAQTYSTYDCFNKLEPFDKLVCFFAPYPGFDAKHYIGLEAPFFAFLQYLLFPNEPADGLTGALVVTLAIAPILMVIGNILMEDTRVAYILSGALFIAYIGSPTVAYFKTSFQPNMLATFLIASSIILASNRKPVVSGITFGLGALSYPQLGLSGLYCLLPFVLAKEKRGALAFLLSGIAVIAAYFLPAYYFNIRGYSEIYRHNIAHPDVFRGGEYLQKYWMTYHDIVGYVGLSFHLVFILTLISLKKHVSWRFFGCSIVISIFAYHLTFVKLIGLFFVNTYYGHILLSYELFLLISLVLQRGPAVRTRVKGRGYYSLAISVAALFSLFIPDNYIQLKIWGDSWVYSQLRGGQEFKCGYLPEKYASNNAYLDCEWADPFCRVAAKYHGWNIPMHDVLASAGAKLTRRDYYASCAGYSLGAHENRDNILKYLRLIDSENGWDIYQLK